MNWGLRDRDRSGSWGGSGGGASRSPPINRSKVVEWLASITDTLTELRLPWCQRGPRKSASAHGIWYCGCRRHPAASAVGLRALDAVRGSGADAYPLTEAEAAHKRLAGGGPHGRLVLVP